MCKTCIPGNDFQDGDANRWPLRFFDIPFKLLGHLTDVKPSHFRLASVTEVLHWSMRDKSKVTQAATAAMLPKQKLHSLLAGNQLSGSGGQLRPLA